MMSLPSSLFSKSRLSIRSFFHRILYSSIDSFQRLLLIENLSTLECEGYLQPRSFMHFNKHLKVSVPFCLGRSVRGLSFANNCDHDLFYGLVADVINNKDLESLSQYLFSHYSRYSSLSAADVVNLPSNTILSRYPEWALVLPWESQDIHSKFKSYINSFISNRTSHGLVIPEGIQRKDINEILYSYSGASSQVHQTHKLFKSFKKYGVIKSKYLPVIDILIDNSQWRWIMSCSGTHRSYILHCMGYDVFESRIGSMVYKNNLKNCLNVRNGLYSIKEAEYIFDLVFDGNSLVRGLV